jgi:predicted AlkP superfamily pyrophosphatase or phosphodiesterase
VLLAFHHLGFTSFFVKMLSCPHVIAPVSCESGPRRDSTERITSRAMTLVPHFKRFTTACALLSVIVFLPPGANPAHAQNEPRAPVARPSTTVRPAPTRVTSASATRPRLVLLIVVDQFRYDYLERFGDLFVENGLKRLMNDGALWTDANFDHMPTYTAPGHATMMTGTWPEENGIIANDWYDRDAQKMVSNVSDPDDKAGASAYQLFGGGAQERASTPRRLTASTLGDELRLATNDRSKVIGISIKDRAAILPAGRHASAAYWFSALTGNMVSTSYYFAQLPAWVERFNSAHRVDELMGRQWTRLLPGEAEYLKRAGVDAPAWEKSGKDTDADVSFPHAINKAQSGEIYAPLDVSPFSNDLLLDFAEQAIVNEGLGDDADTDVLTLSFSANDYVGHRYGPYSQEMMDITLRTDRQIAALLNFVNQRTGLQNTLVVFTADHGVAPIPEQAAALKLDGARISNQQVLEAVKTEIRKRYGRKDAPEDSTADYILNLSNGNLYFNRAALRRDRIDSEELERVAGEAALQVSGINRYFTRSQLQREEIVPTDMIARRVLHGFNARRSGDVILIPDPYKYLDTTIQATHGSPYSYDTHVPLIIMGPGIISGRYHQAATPADIAPTLALLLRVQAPSNSTGRVLTEALAVAARSRRAVRPLNLSGKLSK